MIKVVLIVLLLLLFFFNYAIADKVLYEGSKGNKVVQVGEEEGKRIQIIQDSKIIYEVTPKFRNEIAKEKENPNEVTTVNLIYGELADRGESLKKQPQPFDDITGDGNPDILFYEQGEISNAVPRYYILRLISIKNGKVEEAEPYFGYFGEALHFDDYNNDKVLELVNTDMERYFLYSRDGTPISAYVLLFDKGYKKYYPANLMVNEK